MVIRMYINSLGMRDEINNQNTSSTKTVSTGTFPNEMKKAVQNQNVLSAQGVDAELSLKISEAFEHLKSDPEWADVGTALSALYKNQQQMQVQMSLLSAGYSRSLAGMSGSLGYGSLAASAYGGVSSLLGNSIFGSQLL